MQKSDQKGHKHPVFANKHNQGQQSTQHRSVEEARSLVDKEGKHPEHGQFQEYTPTDKKGMPQAKPGESHFQSPKGEKVSVAVADPQSKDELAQVDLAKIKAANNISEHDRKVTVSSSQSTVTMSKPASSIYLNGRYGIAGPGGASRS